MSGKMKAEQDHKVIRWIIKVFCPGYSLHRKPVRKEATVAAVYPVHKE